MSVWSPSYQNPCEPARGTVLLAQILTKSEEKAAGWAVLPTRILISPKKGHLKGERVVLPAVVFPSD